VYSLVHFSFLAAKIDREAQQIMQSCDLLSFSIWYFDVEYLAPIYDIAKLFLSRRRPYTFSLNPCRKPFLSLAKFHPYNRIYSNFGTVINNVENALPYHYRVLEKLDLMDGDYINPYNK